MIKQNRILLIVTSVVILIPMLAGLLLWNRLPEEIATHFGTNGEPNGWSSRGFTVFGLPLILLALHWLCVIVTAADPRQNGVARKMIHVILWLIPAASLYAGGAIYAGVLGLDFDNNAFMMVFIGLMFIIIGNYLPKCRQNYTVGIKLPWTLADEDNWNRTHRLAGWIWTAAGVLILANAFLGSFIVMLAVLIAAAGIPTVYSFVLWHKKQPR
ncbi:MAG: SdpI family protein [Clostridia bacterium]|nr:SdpI family protein [Clostridia bacterium]MBQ8512676.1 SdpI family protein [Clostridia bacterium]